MPTRPAQPPPSIQLRRRTRSGHQSIASSRARTRTRQKMITGGRATVPKLRGLGSTAAGYWPRTSPPTWTAGPDSSAWPTPNPTPCATGSITRRQSTPARHRRLALSRTWPWRKAFLSSWRRLSALPVPSWQTATIPTKTRKGQTRNIPRASGNPAQPQRHAKAHHLTPEDKAGEVKRSDTSDHC